MTIQSGDVIRVTCKMDLDDQDIRNVYHVKYDGSAAIEDETFMFGVRAALDAAYDYFDQHVPDALTYMLIEGFNVTQDLPCTEEPWPNLTTGTNEGDPLPLQLAPLVVFGNDAPRSSGRKYLPPLSESALDTTGTILSTVWDDFVPYAAKILVDLVFDDGVGQFGVWSKKYERFAPFVNAVVKTVFQTQRRRTLGKGS